MKKESASKLQKVEKEITKMISILTSLKDENNLLKSKVSELEQFKNSTAKDIGKGQKLTSKHETLKADYKKLLIERDQLKEKVEDILKKVDTLQLC